MGTETIKQREWEEARKATQKAEEARRKQEKKDKRQRKKDKEEADKKVRREERERKRATKEKEHQDARLRREKKQHLASEKAAASKKRTPRQRRRSPVSVNDNNNIDAFPLDPANENIGPTYNCCGTSPASSPIKTPFPRHTSHFLPVDTPPVINLETPVFALPGVNSGNITNTLPVLVAEAMAVPSNAQPTMKKRSGAQTKSSSEPKRPKFAAAEPQEPTPEPRQSSRGRVHQKKTPWEPLLTTPRRQARRRK